MQVEGKKQKSYLDFEPQPLLFLRASWILCTYHMPLHRLPTTTSLPGDDPVWALIKSYEETCRNLREMRAQIVSLQAQESLLEARRISINSTLAMVSRRARDQVFATSEIMESIFAFAVCPTTEDNTDYYPEDAFYSQAVRYSDAYPVVHAIARVSSLWRNIAHHTPRLWQRIVFSRWRLAPRADHSCASFRLRSWLRRSFPLPLIIQWEDLYSEPDQSVPWGMPLFDSLTAHSFRWQTAKLQIRFPRYNSSFPLALPKLENLYFYGLGDDSIPALGSMPLLRNLALVGSDTASATTFPWQQLTSLGIFRTNNIPYAVIQSCCTLERLYVDTTGAPFDVEQVVELPSLRHFSLLSPLGEGPLGFLNLTNLDSMTINYDHADLPSVQESTVFFERSSNLRILQINIHQLYSQTFTPLFSIFRSRSVRVLKLKLDVWVLSTDRATLSVLLPQLTPSHIMEQFPTLEEIHIDITSACEIGNALSIESIAFATLNLVPLDGQSPFPMCLGHRSSISAQRPWTLTILELIT
ncbi:hypothetical protein DL96DRAFT_375680 [Flagelloscypha sp. PMI_526]|nr:hypothetical protein DL96DRAFT_375680 [Flagelloscypha sp. PMI_526]